MSLDTTLTAEELLTHSAWLQRLARRLVDPATAEDLVQETWAAAIRSNPDRGRPLRPWLAEVLRNLARSRARSLSRFRARLPRLTATETPLPSPEDLLAFHEAQRLVAESVSALEEPLRSTVLLCYAQEIPPSEVARRQGIPAGTVRWRLKRGLDQIRAALDARHGNDRRAWCAVLAPLAARAAGKGAAAGGATATALAGGRTGLPRLAAGVAAVALAGLAVVQLFPRPSLPAPSDAEGRTPPGLTRLAPTAAAASLPAETSPGALASPTTGLPGAPAAAALAAAGAPPPEAAEAARRATDPADSPARGNPRAPVTIVVWSDFQCPFSAEASSTLRELEATYPGKLLVVYKHLPLPFHEGAFIAAEASLAAHEQGKFWELHARLFASQARLDPQSIEAEVRALGLDLPRFRAALEAAKYRKRVEADLQIATDAQILATPTFFINGERLQGNRPFAAFSEKIDAALATAGDAPPGPPVPRDPGTEPERGPAWVARAPLMVSPAWPPTPVTLPDHLLGPRLAGRFLLGDSPRLGNPRGPVEVLYFTPLAKRQARQTLEGVLATYGPWVRVVAKVMPYAAAPQDPPTLVAEAALYAHAQGKFWAFHDAFTQDVPRPGREQVFEVARQIGLDEADLVSALEARRFRAAVEEETPALDDAGIHDAAFVVEGRLASNSVAVAQLIEEAIRRAGQEPPARPAPGPRPPGDSPTEARHDSEKLLATMSPSQIHGLEPRDETWASVVEGQLAPVIARDLRAVEPKVGATGIECRTTICRVHWQLRGGDPRRLQRFAFFFYSGTGVPRGPSASEHYILLRHPEEKDAQAGVDRVKARRASVLFSVRTGRPANGLRWPLERLPRE